MFAETVFMLGAGAWVIGLTATALSTRRDTNTAFASDLSAASSMPSNPSGLPAGAVEDPGNPGGWLYLADDRHGRRYLVGTDGTPGHDGLRETIRVAVPADFTDPIAAAGWTYGLSADEYRKTARRT